MILFVRFRAKQRETVGRFLLSTIRNKGPGCKICGPGTFLHPDSIQLGNGVQIGENAFFMASGGIEVGNHTIISRNVVVQTQSHVYESNSLPYGTEMVRSSVKIGNAVWIGMDVKILPGVSIGDGAIVGLGAMITKDVPPGAVCVGNPAIVKKYRNMERFQRLCDGAYFKTSGRYAPEKT